MKNKTRRIATLFLAALLLFEGGAMRDELARRLHI